MQPYSTFDMFFFSADATKAVWVGKTNIILTNNIIIHFSQSNNMQMDKIKPCSTLSYFTCKCVPLYALQMSFHIVFK